MKRTALDALPLFADDAAIGQALLGVKRADEWRKLAPIFEGKDGFPPIDATMGGRYVPAVIAFFETLYGLRSDGPKRPDGIERPEAWNDRRRRAVGQR